MILLLFCCSNDIPRCDTTEWCLRSSLNRNSVIALISDKSVSFVCRSKNSFCPNDKKRSDALSLELWDICFYPVLISTSAVNQLTLSFDYVSTCCESQIYGCEILNVVCVVKP